MAPKKIIAFALGPLGGALLGFITLPIITWFFTQEDIGRLAMLNVVTGLSVLLFSLGLDQAYVREFHESENQPALLKVTIFPGLMILIAVLATLLSIDNIISNSLFETDSFELSLLAALAVLCTFISRFLSLILRMNEQGLAYSMSQLLPKLLMILIILSYVILNVTKSFTNLVIANVSAITFVSIVYAWNTRNEWLLSLRQSIDLNYLRKLLKFGMPLILGGLAFWGLTATDKILLKELSNYQQLAIYSVSVSFAAAATIFQSVFSTIWAPTVYKWAANNENLDKIQAVNRYVLLAVIILFCMAGLFSWVVTFFLPSNYNSVQWVLIPCLGYPLFYTLSETTVVGLGVTRRSSFAMLASILALSLNLLANWWLIPIFGAAGAAASTCVSFFILLVFRTEFSIYVWKPIPRGTLYVFSFLLAFGGVFSALYGALHQNYVVSYWLIVFLCSLFFFRKELLNTFSWVTNRTTVE